MMPAADGDTPSLPHVLTSSHWEGGHDARRGRRHAVPPLDDPGVSVSGKKGKSDTYGTLRKFLSNVGAISFCQIVLPNPGGSTKLATRLVTKVTLFAASNAVSRSEICAGR